MSDAPHAPAGDGHSTRTTVGVILLGATTIIAFLPPLGGTVA
jgi:hypothetical protein